MSISYSSPIDLVHTRNIVNNDIPSVNSEQDLKTFISESSSTKTHQVPIEDRRVNDINNEFTNILDYSANKIINESLKNINDNEPLATNFNIQNLFNFLMLENGVLNKLAEDENHHELLFHLFEARVTNSIEDLQNNSKIKKSIAKNLINDLSNELSFFKVNHRNASGIIATMEKYDKLTNNIGLNAKITALLMRSLNCESANNINIDLTKIDKETANIDLLKQLDTFCKDQTNYTHNDIITEAIGNTDLPNFSSTSKQSVLDAFISSDPSVTAKLISSNVTRYVAQCTNLKKILNHECDSKLVQLITMAKDIPNTPEGINNFLKSLPRNQKNYIEKKLVSDIAAIYVGSVERESEVSIPENQIFKHAELHKKYDTAIKLLKMTNEVANKDFIAKLTKIQTEIKANIIESFIKMQMQLELPKIGGNETTDNSKDDKKSIKRMILLEELSQKDILDCLNSTEDADETLKIFFQHIVNYIDAMSAYGKENTVDTRIALHQTRFDMLKSQQTHIEQEAKKLSPKGDYKSKTLNTSNFNEGLEKIAIAYDIRNKKHATFRAVKTLNLHDLKSAALIPSLEYEAKKEDILGSILNDKIKKEVGYSFLGHVKNLFKSVFSIFSKEKKKSLLRQKIDAERAKDPNIHGPDAYKLKQGWNISKLIAGVRANLHYELKYILELSKQNPHLFKTIANNISGTIPLILATFKGDEIIVTLLKEINNKIANESFVDGLVKGKKDQIVKYNEELSTDPQLAEAMRSLYFIQDLTNFADVYIFSGLSIVSVYFPEKTLEKFVNKVAKNFIKSGSVSLAADVLFYLASCIKNNEAVNTTPGEKILKRINFKWVTSYIRGAKRISKAIKNVAARKPNAVKNLFYEIYRFFRTLAITVFFTALIVVPFIALFELALVAALLIALAVVFPILNQSVKDEYGITSDNLSLASYFKNHYLSNMVVKDNYDNPNVKKRFQKEYDMLVSYNDTGDCIITDPEVEKYSESNNNPETSKEPENNTQEVINNNVANIEKPSKQVKKDISNLQHSSD